MTENTRSLTNRAMLCRLSVHMWTARKHDREASNEVAEINNASADAGRFNKLLLDKSELAGVMSAVGALRRHHEANTLPWTIQGVALLPAANYFDYMAEHRKLALALEHARARLLLRYDDAKEARKAKLGDLYREDDYPSQEALHAAIRCEIDVIPMPDAADFRVTLGDAEEARIRDEITASVNAAVAGAVRSLWDRVHATVSAMHDRLTKYQPATDGDRAKNPFRDSLVENMRELVALLPKLNVVGDPALEAMTRELSEKLCRAEPDELREDDNLRKRQADDCARILNIMSGYTGAPAQAAE